MDARLVASRLPAIPMYGQPFNAPHFPGYLPYGPADASAFYSPLPTGENTDAWRAGLTQAAAAAYYDPAFAAHYGYGYGPMGLSDGARRKNATRETTSTLKAWLNEHRKNPYPTKGEKIMLAIITKMTLTQVSTWFANARRRLKKENKMTWSPRNRCGDEDDDDVMDGDDDSNLNNNSNSQMREGHSTSGERNGSRCSTPNPSNLGTTSSEGSNRVSTFDLPLQSNHHPFLPRPNISGSFTIQGSAGRATPGSAKAQNDDTRRQSKGEDDEEIDLESVEEERKEAAFVKRSRSTDSHPTEDTSQRRGSVTSPPTPHLSNILPNVPTHRPFHPNPSIPASASLLGRHHMPPHSHHHGLHPAIAHHPSFGPMTSKVTSRESTSPRAHPYSRNAASSPASSVTSAASASSPSKPKIWSLADVATSNESNRSEEATSAAASVTNGSLATSPTPGLAIFGGRGTIQGLPPHHQSHMNPDAQATIRNWMDGVMQQKMAVMAAMSGGQAPPPPFFPSGLLPQHLAAALNPAALAVAASLPRGADGARFSHPFPGFAELAAAQRAQMTAHVAELQSRSASTVHTTSGPLTQTSSHKSLNEAVLQRHRLVSGHDEKIRSPTSTAPSPPHSDGQSIEVSGFTALNTRPESGDSGIASAETSKDSLAQANESTASK